MQVYSHRNPILGHTFLGASYKGGLLHQEGLF